MVLLFVEMIFLTKVEIIFMVNVQLRLSKKLVSVQNFDVCYSESRFLAVSY